MGVSQWLGGLAPMGSGIRTCSNRVWLERDAGTRNHWGVERGQRCSIPVLKVLSAALL